MSVLTEAILFSLFVTCMALGIVSIIIPLLPSAILIWVGVFIYAYMGEFTVITWTFFGIMTIIAIVTTVADLILTPWGARRSGASGRSLLLGGVGAVVGSFIIPIVGTILGYACGILLSEYERHGDLDASIKAGLGSLAGWGLATAIQMMGSVLILGLFIWRLVVT